MGNNLTYGLQMAAAIACNLNEITRGSVTGSDAMVFGVSGTALCDIAQILVFHLHMVYMSQLSKQLRDRLTVTTAFFSAFHSSTYLAINIATSTQGLQQANGHAGLLNLAYSLTNAYRGLTVYYNVFKLLLWDKSIFGYVHDSLPADEDKQSLCSSWP